jgi:putative heme iron utilization protein
MDAGSDRIMAAKQEPDEAAILEDAARLARASRSGALATVLDGQPNAALVTHAFGADGAPLLLLSSLAVHTRHLLANPACCLLLTGTATSDNPQTTPRLALSGTAAKVEAAEAKAFIITHPYAAGYATFTDFAYWRISLTQAQYIGGFAAAFHLNIAALQHAIIAAAGIKPVAATGTAAYE